MRGEVPGRERRGFLIEADGTGDASLPALGRIVRFGQPACQPQFLVVGKRHQRRIERGAIRRELRGILRRRPRRPAQHVEVQMPAIVRRGARRHRCSALDRLARRRRRVQLAVNQRQPAVSDRQFGIGAQRLLERARRLQPDVGVQIRETLVVERLRVFGRCAHRVVGGPDSRP
jgi:hypothetical protein